MSICVCVCLSLSVSLSLCVCLSLSLSLSVCLSVCVSVSVRACCFCHLTPPPFPTEPLTVWFWAAVVHRRYRDWQLDIISSENLTYPDALNDMTFIGITDFYKTSMCLFYFTFQVCFPARARVSLLVFLSVPVPVLVF